MSDIPRGVIAQIDRHVPHRYRERSEERSRFNERQTLEKLFDQGNIPLHGLLIELKEIVDLIAIANEIAEGLIEADHFIAREIRTKRNF